MIICWAVGRGVGGLVDPVSYSDAPPLAAAEADPLLDRRLLFFTGVGARSSLSESLPCWASANRAPSLPSMMFRAAIRSPPATVLFRVRPLPGNGGGGGDGDGS